MADLSHWMPRHIEILQLIVASRSNTAIAAILSFREKTIELHRRHICADHVLGACRFTTGSSICFDLAQG